MYYLLIEGETVYSSETYEKCLEWGLDHGYLYYNAYGGIGNIDYSIIHR